MFQGLDELTIILSCVSLGAMHSPVRDRGLGRDLLGKIDLSWQYDEATITCKLLTCRTFVGRDTALNALYIEAMTWDSGTSEVEPHGRFRIIEIKGTGDRGERRRVVLRDESATSGGPHDSVIVDGQEFDSFSDQELIDCMALIEWGLALDGVACTGPFCTW